MINMRIINMFHILKNTLKLSCNKLNSKLLMKKKNIKNKN